jgi:hypothetical protein
VRFLIEVETAQCLPGGVADDEALGVLLDRPSRGACRRRCARRRMESPSTDRTPLSSGRRFSRGRSHCASVNAWRAAAGRVFVKQRAAAPQAENRFGEVMGTTAAAPRREDRPSEVIWLSVGRPRGLSVRRQINAASIRCLGLGDTCQRQRKAGRQAQPH